MDGWDGMDRGEEGPHPEWEAFQSLGSSALSIFAAETQLLLFLFLSLFAFVTKATSSPQVSLFPQCPGNLPGDKEKES